MKTALVTGSGRRLGKEIALSLVNSGWHVIWHYNTSKPPSNVTSVQADLTDFTQLPKLFQHGKIDLLINNASIFEKKTLLESAEQDFDRNFSLHVKAPYFLSQYFANQGGNHIINIVDSSVCRNKNGHFPYLLSKKSLLNLSAMLAVELAPNIRVNSILPGILNDFSENLDHDLKKRRLENIPQNSLASSANVIEAIHFLNNSNLTGQEIYVDGGEQLI